MEIAAEYEMYPEDVFDLIELGYNKENKKRMSGKYHSLPGHSLIDYNVSITIPCSVSDSG